jgi:hypothetical protein
MAERETVGDMPKEEEHEGPGLPLLWRAGENVLDRGSNEQIANCPAQGNAHRLSHTAIDVDVPPGFRVSKAFPDSPLPKVLAGWPTIEGQPKIYLHPRGPKDRKEVCSPALCVIQQTETGKFLNGTGKRIIGGNLWRSRPVLGRREGNSGDLQAHLAEMSSESPLYRLLKVSQVKEEMGHVGWRNTRRGPSEKTAA